MAGERWQMMKESMLKSAKEHDSCHQTKGRQKWMTAEILDLISNGGEKKSQGTQTEIQRTRQTSEKEVQ